MYFVSFQEGQSHVTDVILFSIFPYTEFLNFKGAQVSIPRNHFQGIDSNEWIPGLLGKKFGLCPNLVFLSGSILLYFDS